MPPFSAPTSVLSLGWHLGTWIQDRQRQNAADQARMENKKALSCYFKTTPKPDDQFLTLSSKSRGMTSSHWKPVLYHDSAISSACCPVPILIYTFNPLVHRWVFTVLRMNILWFILLSLTASWNWTCTDIDTCCFTLNGSEEEEIKELTELIIIL